MRWRRQSSFAICVLLICSLAGSSIAIQESQPDRSAQRKKRDQERLIREAIQLLIGEAFEIQRGQRALPEQADIASRATSIADTAAIGLALVARTHREPFVDAYVRWQLTSFDPLLPELDDRAFAAFMDQAPPLIENPRADERNVVIFRRADEAGPLGASDLQKLREMTIELDLQTAKVEGLNRPAFEFRQWVQSKLGEAGPRPYEWLLERCAATVQAGWSARAAKTEITKRFTDASADASLTDQDKALIASRAKRLIGMGRPFVNEISFMADGSVRVSFSNSAVDEADVRKWIERLNDGREPGRP